MSKNKLTASVQLRAFAPLGITLVLCSTWPLLAQVPARPSTAIPSGEFRIAGVLVNQKSAHSLAGARVVLTDTKNRQSSQSMVTSEDGQFAFQVPAGKYSLEAAKRGFIPAFYNQHDEFSTAIVAGAGLDTDHLILRLPPVAVLTGKILDEFGEPVRHASVTAYREDRRSGVGRVQTYTVATTDDQGTYELTPLNDGTYFVSVTARPWYAVHPAATQEDTGALPFAVEQGLDTAYPVTYYGDATESDDAVPIPIKGGDLVEADIHLSPVPALHLLVRVASNGNHGFTMPQFQKSVFDETTYVNTDQVRMVSEGVFEMTGIPAGRYMVLVSGGQDNQTPEPREINLATDGQELDLSSGSPTSTVKARVQVVGEKSVPSPVAIGLRNSKGKVVARGEVNAQREVTFQNVIAGQYTVVAGSPAKAYSVKIQSGGDDHFSNGLNVPAGASVDVTLALIGGEVTVQGVVKQAGKPVSGAMVVLVPKDPESNRELFRRDQSDQDGTFSLQSVIPGSYTIIAIDNGWELDWGKPAVLGQYIKSGQSITVTKSARGEMQLPDPVEVQLK